MTTYITHVRLSPPTSQDHQHITDVRWEQSGSSGSSSRQSMVDFINKGNAVYVKSNPSDVKVHVVDANPPYLRTQANGKWSDNLLSLPRF